MGLFGAAWQHSINQKVFSVLNYTDGLQRYLTRQHSSHAPDPVIARALSGITEAMESIRSVGFASPVPAERPDNHTKRILIDAELPELVQRWCHGRGDIQIHFDLIFLKQTIPNCQYTSGTGVGALIVRFVLLQHGGDVEMIDSQEGRGTIIQMRLPITTDINTSLIEK